MSFEDFLQRRIEDRQNTAAREALRAQLPAGASLAEASRALPVIGQGRAPVESDIALWLQGLDRVLQGFIDRQNANIEKNRRQIQF